MMTGRLASLMSLAARLTCPRVGREVGLVAGHFGRVGVDELGLFGEDILGDVDEHRSGPAGGGNVEGLADDRGDLFGGHHQVVVLGDGQGNAGDVGFLKGIAADGGAAHLAGDGDHRDGVHLCGGDAGHEIGGAGAGRGPTHAGASGGAGVAVGGVRGALLVAHQYVAQTRELGQCLVQGKNGSAGEAEDHVHALSQQAFANHLSAIHLHGKANLRGLFW